MYELVPKVEDWFHIKGLADQDPKIQMLKLYEEFGELASALDLNDKVMIIDSLGDIQVVLIGVHVQFKYRVFIPNLEAQEVNHSESQLLMFIKHAGELSEYLAKGKDELILEALTKLQVTTHLLHLQLGYEPLNTLKVAYDEIKDRTGEVKNGNFVKTKDLT